MADADGSGSSSGNDAYHKKPISEWQESDIEAVKEFIQATVLTILFKALCELVKERPDDPIQYVIDFLVKYKDEYSKDINLSQAMESRSQSERRPKPEEINHWVEISLATNSQTEESLESFYDSNPQIRKKFEESSSSSKIQHNLSPQTSLKSEEPSTSEILLDKQCNDVKEASSLIEHIDLKVKRWQMKWKKTFPSKRPQTENPKEGYNILPTRFYLEATVLSIVMDALNIIIVERPEDSIQCMIDFMKKYKAHYQ